MLNFIFFVLFYIYFLKCKAKMQQNNDYYYNLHTYSIYQDNRLKRCILKRIESIENLNKLVLKVLDYIQNPNTKNVIENLEKSFKNFIEHLDNFHDETDTYATSFIKDLCENILEKVSLLLTEQCNNKQMENMKKVFQDLNIFIFTEYFQKMILEMKHLSIDFRFWQKNDWIYELLKDVNSISEDVLYKPQPGDYYSFTRIFCLNLEKIDHKNVYKLLNKEFKIDEYLKQDRKFIIEFLLIDFELYCHLSCAYAITKCDNEYIDRYLKWIKGFD